LGFLATCHLLRLGRLDLLAPGEPSSHPLPSFRSIDLLKCLARSPGPPAWHSAALRFFTEALDFKSRQLVNICLFHYDYASLPWHCLQNVPFSSPYLGCGRLPHTLPEFLVILFFSHLFLLLSIDRASAPVFVLGQIPVFFERQKPSYGIGWQGTQSGSEQSSAHKIDNVFS